MAGWNGLGAFTRLYSWVSDAAAGIDITASRMDADTDLISGNGFGNCLTRDGQGQPTADLPMASFKHTGVQNASGPAEYVAFGQLGPTASLSPTFVNLTLTTNLSVEGIAGFAIADIAAANVANLTTTGTVALVSGAALGGTNTAPITNAVDGAYFNTSGGLNMYSHTFNPLALGTSGSALVEFFFGGPSAVGSISTNGSATAYNTTSDARLKIDDGCISGADSGRLIDRLAPRWFRWKANADAAPELGFFAQQVHRVFPWAVTRGRGRPGSKNFRPWQIDQAKLMALAIAEIQSLRARVAALETRRNKGAG